MKHIIITNNPMVKERFPAAEYIASYGMTPVLTRGRDLIHQGYVLETHPLSGSIKPNETPYKTILLREGEGLDQESLILIEQALSRVNSFLSQEPLPRWKEHVLRDFQVIDLDLFGNKPID